MLLSLKVEATKFTEVGYVGRDVEQIIRDLVEISINKTKEKMGQEVKGKSRKKCRRKNFRYFSFFKTSSPNLQEKPLDKNLGPVSLNDKEVEIPVSANPSMRSYQQWIFLGCLVLKWV